MKVTLYTTHCPRCNILKKKMVFQNILFTEVEGEKAVESMIAMGFSSAPVLVVDDEVMNYEQAIKWVNQCKQEGENN